jgi:hypothetical protein
MLLQFPQLGNSSTQVSLCNLGPVHHLVSQSSLSILSIGVDSACFLVGFDDRNIWQPPVQTGGALLFLNVRNTVLVFDFEDLTCLHGLSLPHHKILMLTFTVMVA